MKKIGSLSLLALLAGVHVFAQQPKFELADVHASKTPRWFAQNGGAVLRDGHYTIRDATLLSLIETAYGVNEDSVGGGPSWLDTDIFEVIAKVPEGTNGATAKLMLQSLLAERFGLMVRNEKRPMPRYVLTVGKGGSKMKPATGSGDPVCQQQMIGVEPGKPAVLQAGSLPNLKATCHNLNSQQIAENLRQLAAMQINSYLPRDVFDATGLEGKWDFDFEYTPIGVLEQKGRDGITLFDAVNKQLGLNLELKDVPVTSLVVESANRKPTPNPPGVSTDLRLAAARFEVASIKLLSPEVRNLGSVGGSEVRLGGNLKSLIGQAFYIQPNAQDDEILGLPKSVTSQTWIITAKLPSTGDGAPLAGGARPQPPPRAVLMEMLRGLLADQFELKTHTENREITVYAMTVSGKPKMVQAAGTERMSCKVDPAAQKPFPNMGSMVQCINITMDEFAENLQQATGFFDHPIVNATGLQGGWNFLIGWSRVEQAGPRGIPNPNAGGGGAADATEPTGLTSYEAVERQLGVKLVKQKRSIPVIVVDHIAEKPVE
ncbi:MAG TPA: TIGR03435 family protein [Bryobacteraceae bacterium]